MPYRNAFDVMVKPFFVVFSFVIPRKLSKLFVMSNNIVSNEYYSNCLFYYYNKTVSKQFSCYGFLSTFLSFANSDT